MRKTRGMFIDESGAMLIAVIVALVVAASGAALLANLYTGLSEGHRGSISAYQANLLAESGVRYGRHVVLRDMKNHVAVATSIANLNGHTFTLADGNTFSIAAVDNSGQVTVSARGQAADAVRGWLVGPVVPTGFHKPPSGSRPPPEAEMTGYSGDLDYGPAGAVWTGDHYPGAWGGGGWGTGGTSRGDGDSDGRWDGHSHH